MADKTKSIKSSSDQELNDLIIRLRRECEAQGLISDLKRRATSDNDMTVDVYGNRNYDYSVSTEQPIESMYHNEGVDAILKHFGVPGMKWGRHNFLRKAGNIVGYGGIHHLPGAVNKAGQKIKNKIDVKKQEDAKTHSEDYKQSQGLKTKTYKQMSNKELQSLNTRMQLEKNLRDLKSMDVQKGVDVVKTLTAAGTTVASLYALSTTPLGQAVKKILTK